MKELTIEQKAKRYDEALKNAMIYYKNGNEDMKMMMKTCFPVLAEESEDERMKKIISDILLIDSDDIREILESNDVVMQDIDAWLEKQGEQKPTWSEEDEEALDMCINAIPKAWKTKSGILLTKWLKKRFYQQLNQKWDKKDSEIMDELIYELNQRPLLGSLYIAKFTNWLKSLKERMKGE